jgi:hypothetical protein
MRLLKSLLFLATLAAAEKVPVLTEPMVVSAQGTTLDAGGDTVYLAGKGVLGKYLRTSIQVQTVETSQSTALDADQPLMFVCGFQRCVVGSDSIFRNAYANISLTAEFGGRLGISNGYANARDFSGSSYVPGGSNGSHFLVAGDATVRDFVYAYRSEDSVNIPSSGYRLKDSLSSTWGHPLLGFFGSYNRFGAMAIPVHRGKYAVLADSSKYLLRSVHVDTLQADSLNWIVANEEGSWLAYDQMRSTFYRKGLGLDGSVRIDSIPVPELKPGTRRTYQVTHVDSLLVFNTDSSVVLARWTSNEFRILSIVSLGRPVLATAISSRYDPVSGLYSSREWVSLWATTGSELYSFKLAWQDANSTSVRPLALGTRWIVRDLQGGVEFHWKGEGVGRMDLVGLDGKSIATLNIQSGQSIAWQAPSRGVYFARSAEGSRKILVR